MRDLLLSYAQDLDDAYPGYEFSIWSAEELLRYFNEALCVIARYRPEMFTELKVVKVNTCGGYLDLCDCVKVLDVLGQSDKNGQNIRPIQRRKEQATVWSGSKLKKGYTNTITEYELLDKSNLVRVFPENLDPTQDIYVTLRCSVEPKVYTLDDEAPNERCAFMVAARRWVLYEAFNKDGEFSQSMQIIAKGHNEMFFTLLKVAKDADDNYDEKNFGSPKRSK